MPATLSEMLWPLERLGDALAQVASLLGCSSRTKELRMIDTVVGQDVRRWIECTCEWAGVEAQAVYSSHDDLETLFLNAGPALVTLDHSALVLLGRRGRYVTLLSPTAGRTRMVHVDLLCDAARSGIDQDLLDEVDEVLQHVTLSPAGYRRAHRALVSERLGSQPFSGCWSLRPPPGASFWAQARVDGLPQRAAFMVGLHLLLTAVTILGYTLLGYAALEGRLELGWLLGWGLLLLTEVPVYLYVQWLQGELVVSFGKLLKRRLLAGALRMDADDIGRAGAGQLTGRALEVQSIDSLALGGGVRSILAITEVVPLAVWLSWGTGGLGPALMLGTFLLISFSLGWGAYLRARRWADAQRGLSQELVERMLGHRTRLVQQPEDRRHEGEDPPLARYLSAAREVDGYEVILQALPYAWMILGLAFVAPGFIRGDSSGQVAIAVGGTLLAFASFLGLGQGLMQIAHAAAGWQQLSPLFDAGALPVAQPSPAIEAIHSDESGTGVLLDATGLTFRYPDRQEPVLRDVHLHVRRGDRVLLEGPSGGGKTTLASVLSGLRQPTSGLLLLDGFDFPTLGERGWRARVAAAPQYHENHVFMDSFAFNAQLGATAGREDEDEAHEVLEELGLDDLIARMPGGLDQQVGESGWRLSHGERSRLFIARALIQKAPLVVLDESFGALDPKTMARCLRCVLKRAPTLIVIAHP